MRFLHDVVQWFGEAQHWHGSNGIPQRMWEHVQLSAFAVGMAALVALPVGVLFGHLRRGGFAAVTVANIGRAIPSFAILALALPLSIRLGLGLGFWPTFVALFLLAIPPMVINAYTGVRGVDRAVIEAARGMGMRPAQLLLRVELPLASPVVLAGVRVAAVQVVATATLGALVAWGGLGRYIVDGFQQRDTVKMFAGAVLVATLAIATEVAFVLLDRVVLPRGLRRRGLAQEVKAETPPA